METLATVSLVFFTYMQSSEQRGFSVIQLKVILKRPAKTGIKTISA